jgi:hypothetical protein
MFYLAQANLLYQHIFQTNVLKGHLKMWVISTNTIYVDFSTLLAWMQLD